MFNISFLVKNLNNKRDNFVQYFRSNESDRLTLKYSLLNNMIINDRGFYVFKYQQTHCVSLKSLSKHLLMIIYWRWNLHTKLLRYRNYLFMAVEQPQIFLWVVFLIAIMHGRTFNYTANMTQRLLCSVPMPWAIIYHKKLKIVCPKRIRFSKLK